MLSGAAALLACECTIRPAYKAPGTNSDGVGTTDDPNIIRALFLARDNARVITGYTDNSGRIGWLDY